MVSYHRFAVSVVLLEQTTDDSSFAVSMLLGRVLIVLRHPERCLRQRRVPLSSYIFQSRKLTSALFALSGGAASENCLLSILQCC